MTIGRRDARPPVPASVRVATKARGGSRIAAAFLCLGLLAAGDMGALTLNSAMAAPVARQSYSVTDFDMVRLEAPIEVTITSGKSTVAVATGDRDTLDSLLLSVSSRTLTIHLRPMTTIGGSGGKARAPTRLTLTTGELRRAIVLGSGTLTADRLKGARVDASVQGSGALTIPRVEADQINVGLLGAGAMVLGGAVLDMTASVSGTGRLDANALNAQRLRIDTEGSVDVQVKAIREARASANGTGRIVVAGDPQCTVRKTGNASVTCGGEVY